MVPVAFLAALAVADVGGPALPTDGRSAAVVEQTFQVGQIFITGHEDAISSLILDRLGLSPGQQVTWRELRQAEQRLGRLGVFVNDAASGVQPQITTETTGGLTNLRVQVVEKSKIAH